VSAQARWTAPAAPASIGRLRAAVVQFAADAGFSREVLGDVRLAVSEALTNAVVHGYRDDAKGELSVCARLARADRLEVVVEDDGIGLQPRLDSPGLGIGLPTIATLAAESTVTTRAGGGTVVRMTFARG
jgi:serine/threonine-protein kinase RsbW/stage II sporulation protein AB (anti-sigma F factor)